MPRLVYAAFQLPRVPRLCLEAAGTLVVAFTFRVEVSLPCRHLEFEMVAADEAIDRISSIAVSRMANSPCRKPLAAAAVSSHRG